MTSHEGRCEVTRADPFGAESLLLVAKLWTELGSIYGLSQLDSFTPEQISGPGTAFVLARLNGRAVGCGAIVPLRAAGPQIAELKRMFVVKESRRFGIAAAILAALETEACAAGYEALWLETGLKQPAAIALYEGAGYRGIARYGRYRDDPLSVCYERRLT